MVVITPRYIAEYRAIVPPAYGPRLVFCLSVCLSVRLVRSPNSIAERRIKSRIGVNLLQGRNIAGFPSNAT